MRSDRAKVGFVGLLALALVFLSACDRDGTIFGPGPIEVDVGSEGIPGSGNVVVEERQASEFSQVLLRGEGQVVVTLGAEESLTVETDDNLLQYIDTDVTGGVLEISTASGIDIDPTESVIYRVGMTAVTGLELSGAGSVEIGTVVGDDLRLALSGVGSISVGRADVAVLDVAGSGVGSVAIDAGDVGEATIAVSGVVDYVAGDVRCARVTADVGGTSSATFWVTEMVAVSVTDTASVSYFGLPGSVTEDVGGQGTVTELGDK